MKTLVFFATALCALAFGAEKHAENLSEAEAAIGHSEGKEAFDEQMKGTPRKNGFGELPQGLNRDRLLSWLAPNDDPALLYFAGARSWGGKDRYVAAACFAVNKQTLDDARKYYSDAVCRLNEDGFKFFLGVFDFANGKFAPVAKSEDISDMAFTVFAAEVREVLPNYHKFDLADYRLNEKEKAFGVRGGYDVGYAGGGAFYEFLALFRVTGGEIVKVFGEQMYGYENIAGDWNDDGTRQHDIYEAKSTLHVLKTKTDGFFDWELRSDEGEKTRYRWSKQYGIYSVE